ncbi:hypothetical protein GQ600_15117 [Phytophthora cactorum]|nr:hypothetical protein GQ600_15117 [Phytophthora cactorum]
MSSIVINYFVAHAQWACQRHPIGFVDKKSQTIYSWIDWIVSYNLLFSFLGNQTVAKYAAVQTISPETAEEYMALLTKTLERYIAGIIPKKFGIVWDGCTFRSEHYMAFLGVPPRRQDGEDPAPHGSSRGDDIVDHSAHAHASFLQVVLGYFDRSLADVL